MTNYADYLTWLAQGTSIRVSARAIIFNPARDHILVERNDWIHSAFYNFIGGGVELNETLQECIARELAEETDAHITAARYLFVVENFFAYENQMRHSLEHYFEIELDREIVAPKRDGVDFSWVPLHQLPHTDLRPSVVRDSIYDGAFSWVDHLILRDPPAM